MLISKAEIGSDLTRMNLQQLNRVLSQPESLEEVKTVVRELVRRENEASKSDARASLQAQLFKLNQGTQYIFDR